MNIYNAIQATLILTIITIYSSAHAMIRISQSIIPSHKEQSARALRNLEQNISKQLTLYNTNQSGYVTTQDLENKRKDLQTWTTKYPNNTIFKKAQEIIDQHLAVKKAIKEINEKIINNNDISTLTITDNKQLTPLGENIITNLITIGNYISQCDEQDRFYLTQLKKKHVFSFDQVLSNNQNPILKEDQKENLEKSIAKIKLLLLGINFPLTVDSVWEQFWKQFPMSHITINNQQITSDIIDIFSPTNTNEQKQNKIISEIQKNLNADKAHAIMKRIYDNIGETQPIADQAIPLLKKIFTKEERTKFKDKINAMIAMKHKIMQAYTETEITKQELAQEKKHPRVSSTTPNQTKELVQSTLEPLATPTVIQPPSAVQPIKEQTQYIKQKTTPPTTNNIFKLINYVQQSVTTLISTIPSTLNSWFGFGK